MLTDIDTLILAAIAGPAPAWQALWLALDPELSRMIARPRFLGPLSVLPQHADARAGIAIAVMARLHERGFHRLRCYLAAKEADPGLVFGAWLHVVAKRVAIDHLRAHPDYVRRELRWIETTPLDDAPRGVRPPVTRDGTAREIVRHAADVLPPAQADAIGRWASGERLGEAPQRRVRAALQRLRRHFREASQVPSA